MSAIKPVFRELREAALNGGVHAKDKLHQLTERLDGHFDTVIRQVKNNDRYDGPGGNGGSGSGPSNGPPYSHGVRFFGGDQLHYYTDSNATLGRKGSAVFMMPSEDAVNVGSHMDAAIESGLAPNVTEAVLRREPVYGAMIPVDHLPQRLPTAQDAGGFTHFHPGGYTAVNVDGVHYVNSTREFVVDGGTPLPSGTVVFELTPDGAWDILGIYE
ncbi:hypothetical protein [Marisediminicola sp. LYQ134]|uniref:hypothetical protein n=1 Tax=Marisediminicola sp. LYQ134 TaxID=3391061 RepID=UPI0039833E5B